MKNLKVKNILLTSFAIMAALTLFIGGMSIYGIEEMNKRGRNIYDYTPVVGALGAISGHFQKINSDLYRMAVNIRDFDDAEYKSLNADMDFHAEKIKTAIDEYMATAFDKETEKNFHAFKNKYENDFLPLMEQTRLILSSGDVPGGVLAAVVSLAGIADEIEAYLFAAVEDNVLWHDKEISSTRDVANAALTTQSAAIIISLALSLSFAFYLSSKVGHMSSTIERQAAHIKDENRRIKVLLDTSPLACRLWNRGYEIFECNEEALRLFGITDKNEFMERYFDFSPEFQPDGKNSREKIMEVLDTVFACGRTVLEWLYKLPDGAEIPCEITLVRVKYEDDYVIAGYSRDLRESKKMMDEIRESALKLEEALTETKRANEAKSDFLANMSHEMRTPLNAVIGLSGLSLEAAGLDTETVSNLEKIYSSGEMLLRIVNDILDISKIEAGRMELVEYVYDVASLINDAVIQNSLMIGDKDLELKLDIEDDLFARLYGDELRVKQIINNLLSNAVKYTPAGRVELVVRCAEDGGLVWVTIKVSDTGVGIRAEDMGELFKDYSQLDLKVNRNAESTGLGLPIAKSLAEMMQGEITVESAYGKGSVFTVRLAQKKASEARIGRETAESLKSFRYSGVKRGRNMRLKRVSLPYARVLVVDDNLTNLDVARGLMKPYGMQVDCVTGGREAVELVRGEKTRYNAIFMDHMMPGVDGIEATRMIREEIGTEYAQNIPIIALTANALTGSETMFLEKGFQAFISKPVEIGRLDEVIRHFVRDKDQEKLYAELTGRAFTPDGQIERARADRRSGIDRRAFGMGIKGLDFAKGVRMMGGDEETYFDVLKSFALNTPTVLDSIEDAGDMDEGLYAVAVHGIKGTGRAVGADALADIAERLEKAAKNGDRAFIKFYNPPFIQSARRFVSEIDDMLKHERPAAEKPKKDKPDAELLRQLSAASEQYDTDRIDVLVSELDAYQYETGGGVTDELVLNARLFDFKRNVELIAAYLGAEA